MLRTITQNVDVNKLTFYSKRRTLVQQGIQRYVSRELSHFVGRGLTRENQFGLLLRILEGRWLTHPPHNPNQSGALVVNQSAKISSNEMYVPQVVCFSDIPVEDLHIHATKYSPFGLAFSKTFIANQGGCPVFYLPRGTRLKEMRNLDTSEIQNLDLSTREKIWESLLEEVAIADVFDRMIPEFQSLMRLFHDLIRKAAKAASITGRPADDIRLQKLEQFFAFRLISHMKFFDETLDDEDPENFYMEREWRVVGNVKFELNDVRRVIIPEAYASRFRQAIPQFVGQVSFSD
jgi:Putative abortive phage resistance protein AbiGi, antitoxin